MAIKKVDDRLTYEQVEKLYTDTLNHFCEFTGISKEMLLSKSRLRILVDARNTLTHLLFRQYLNYYYIARFIGKDRSNIYHSLKRVSEMWETDNNYREFLCNLKLYIHEANNKRASQKVEKCIQGIASTL